ncbi:hypothetical protein MRB53_037495 [Persea americana]|nr:hypothetical protein MRB53_037495 [Persea americana]
MSEPNDFTLGATRKGNWSIAIQSTIHASIPLNCRYIDPTFRNRHENVIGTPRHHPAPCPHQLFSNLLHNLTALIILNSNSQNVLHRPLPNPLPPKSRRAHPERETRPHRLRLPGRRVPLVRRRLRLGHARFRSSIGRQSGQHDRQHDRYLRCDDAIHPPPPAALREAPMQARYTPDARPDEGAKGYDTAKGGPQTSYSGAAPSGVSSTSTSASTGKPGGRGVTEGGFDGDAPNASWSNDIGGKGDPGRVAERDIQKGGVGDAKEARRDLGGFENLKEESA